MSKWNRPMRQYRPDRVPCADCGEPITLDGRGQWRVVDGAVYHPDCGPRPDPSPELAARIARRRKP